MHIDLNCDMGESFGRYRLGFDTEVMPLISSANIACGFHAGDPVVMRHTVEMAAEHGVALGAHPGFPDLAGFGRRRMQVSSEELRNMLIYQVGALMGFAHIFDASLQHVKPHGALYNLAAYDERTGVAVVDAILELKQDLILFVLAGSRLLKIAREGGLRVAREAFADRAYQDDGTLVPRRQEGAVLTDTSAITDRVLKMVLNRKVTTITGTEIDLEADTICVHGDTPGAVTHIKTIHAALQREEISMVSAGSFV
jgi:UPF0271 protein